MFKLILIVFIILIMVNISYPFKIDFVVNLDNTPIISRYRGFTALIPIEILNVIDKDSLEFYINGEDFTDQLKMDVDAKNGALYIYFKPKYPLPIGSVLEKITGVTKEGKAFEKTWSFMVDPSSDKDLAKLFNVLKKDRNNIQAHLGIALIYENKYLLADAQNEYLNVLQLDPKNEVAKKAYDRIFALWDQKSIKYGNLTIDVYIDTSLLKLGKLLMFNLKITNQGETPLTISPEKWTLIDESGKQFECIKSLSDYPKKALDRGWISRDDYARLIYFLNNRSFPILNEQAISPSATVKGYLVFTFSGDRKIKKILLSISEQDTGGNKETFLFPFIIP